MTEENNSDDITRTHSVLAVGTMIAHYRIVDKIGAGGMGEVYLAEDTKLKRRVALKFLPAHLTSVEEIKQRFLREAQAVAKLNHPNIVTIHDVSENQGRPYFVMEHVEGQSLHHFAHDEPLPIETVVEYAIQICQGIGEAHRAGIVHRDIKASNIVVDSRGRARLLDFGLAAVAGDDPLTRTGSTLGTVSYMSPEQVSGRDIDQRSDLFSLGIVLYELIAGRTPFRRDNEGATLRAIMQDTPEPLTRYKADVPERLQHVVEKLLEKDREMRYQTAEDVIADLKRLMYDSQQSVVRRPEPKRRSRTGVLVGIAAGVVVVLAVAGWFLFGRAPEQAAPTDRGLPVIVVLPFENLGSPDDEYFADGMTEEITSRLAGIDGLGVISRTSAMQYKHTDKPLSEIGKELGVTYVLEGSVRWAKEGGQARVRITPRLVRVSDDRNVWADNYERKLIEVFAVQEDIATQIVSQLGLTLIESDKQALAARPTENSEAYDYYLKGIAGIRQEQQSIQPLMETASKLDTAVMLDPKFALAFAARSRAYSRLAFATYSRDDEQVARESFQRALELQPDLATGHMAAGVYYNLVETDYDRALEQFNMARSEMHNDGDLLASIALVQMRQGKFDEANENYTRAAQLDPLNPTVHASRANCLQFTRSYAEAEKAIDRAIALEPSRTDWYVQKMNLYASRYGDMEKIRTVAAAAEREVDPRELFQLAWWQLGFLGGQSKEVVVGTTVFPVDSIITLLENNRRDQMEPEVYYGSLAHAYGATGHAELSTVYWDSARVVLETHLQDSPDDPHRTSMLGYVMACLGKCEEAEKLAEQGKEMLSIAKCHW